MEEDINQTASGFYLAKIVNGKVPLTVIGGEYDGLPYFPISIDGVEYWLLEHGLVNPPETISED